MGSFRWIFGLPTAAAITLLLFLLMSVLIRQDVQTATAKTPPDISILPKIIETPVKPPIVRPTEMKPPPRPDDRWVEKPERGPEGIQVPIERGPIEPGPPDGKPMQPILKIPPGYPEACRSRSAEGVVLVQFDVTDRGEVTNVRVISSDNRCFDRAVVRAVLGWKYPPSARAGVTERFVFTLTE